MMFNTFGFFVFLLCTLAIYCILPRRWRNPFLLAASFVFYMQWRWEFGILLAVQILIHYFCALSIAGTENERKRKSIVIFAAVCSFGILGYYKYFNFFNDTFSSLFADLGMKYMIPHLNMILPIGISFYTFQAFGYTMDVYCRRCEAERNLTRFALFVSFFPQLASGPIGRAPALLPQIAGGFLPSAENTATGIRLILWGLFKKAVIADRLALYVDAAYADPERVSGATLFTAAYFFAIQIYCDFSGYSDMAIGAAKLFGCDLMRNFDLPYFSGSISEFWKRWHISLTTCFRDYLYIPLGGSRVSRVRWGLNIIIVFLVSGLWHGASWTFVIWGALHGIYYFVEAFLKILFPSDRGRKSVFHGILSLGKMMLTFHAVVFAWIFFRATTFSGALTIIRRIGTSWGRISFGGSQVTFALNLLLILLLFTMDFAAGKGWIGNYFSKGSCPGWLRVIGSSALAAGIALLGVSSSSFIYLQF